METAIRNFFYLLLLWMSIFCLTTTALYWRQIDLNACTQVNDHSATTLNSSNILIFGGKQKDGYTNKLQLLQLEVGDCAQIETTGELPSPRGGHSSTLLPENRLFVYGGEGVFNYVPVSAALADSYVLDIEKQHWTKIPLRGQPPGSRVHHRAVLVGKSLYLYGGHDDYAQLSTIHKMDIDTYTWSLVTVSGEPSLPITDHTMVVWENRLVTFGGKLRGSTINSLGFFDIETTVWNMVDSGTTRRSGHSAILLQGDSAMIIFGGKNASGGCVPNLALYSFATDTWKEIKSVPFVPTYRHSANLVFREGKAFVYYFGGTACSGSESRTISNMFCLEIGFPGTLAPLIASPDNTDVDGFAKAGIGETMRVSPRYGHSSVLISDDNVILFGGKIGGKLYNTYFNDLVNYDTVTGNWSPVPLMTTSPNSRAYHSATYLPKFRKVIFFGGEFGFFRTLSGELTVYDPDLVGCTEQPAEGSRPSPRRAHTTCAFENTNELVLFGGENFRVALNDIFVLYISSAPETYTWKQLSYNSNSDSLDVILPLPRSDHCAVMHNNVMWVFGGYDFSAGKYYDDLVSFEFDLENSLVTARVHLPSSSRTPPPRKGHVCAVSQGKFIVFGGKNKTHDFHDLWSLDLDAPDKHWRLYKVDPPIKARWGMSAVLTKSGTLTIFGGVGAGVFKDVNTIEVGQICGWEPPVSQIENPPTLPPKEVKTYETNTEQESSVDTVFSDATALLNNIEVILSSPTNIKTSSYEREEISTASIMHRQNLARTYIKSLGSLVELAQNLLDIHKQITSSDEHLSDAASDLKKFFQMNSDHTVKLAAISTELNSRLNSSREISTKLRESQSSTKMETLRDIQQTMTQLRDKVSSLREEISTGNKSLRSLLQQKEQLEKDLANANAQHPQVHIADLEEREKKLHTELEQLTSLTSTIDQQLAELEAEKKFLENESLKLDQQERILMEAEKEEAEESQHKKRKSSLLQELLIPRKSSSTDYLFGDFESREKKFLDAVAAQIKKDKEATETQLSLREKSIQTAIQESNQYLEKRKKLTTEFEHVKASIEKAKDIMRALEKNKLQIESKISEVQTSINNTKIVIENSTNLLHKNQNELEILTEQSATLERQAAADRLNIDDLLESRQKLASQIAHLSKEARDAVSVLEAIKKQVSEKKQLAENLAKQNNILREEFTKMLQEFSAHKLPCEGTIKDPTEKEEIVFDKKEL